MTIDPALFPLFDTSVTITKQTSAHTNSVWHIISPQRGGLMVLNFCTAIKGSSVPGTTPGISAGFSLDTRRPGKLMNET